MEEKTDHQQFLSHITKNTHKLVNDSIHRNRFRSEIEDIDSQIGSFWAVVDTYRKAEKRFRENKTEELAKKTKPQLIRLAADEGIKVLSRWKKTQIINTIVEEQKLPGWTRVIIEDVVAVWIPPGEKLPPNPLTGLLPEDLLDQFYTTSGQLRITPPEDKRHVLRNKYVLLAMIHDKKLDYEIPIIERLPSGKAPEWVEEIWNYYSLLRSGEPVCTDNIRDYHIGPALREKIRVAFEDVKADLEEQFSVVPQNQLVQQSEEKINNDDDEGDTTKIIIRRGNSKNEFSYSLAIKALMAASKNPEKWINLKKNTYNSLKKTLRNKLKEPAECIIDSIEFKKGRIRWKNDSQIQLEFINFPKN